jgi:serine/threonine protein kinase
MRPRQVPPRGQVEPFEKLEELGSGGFAHTFRARVSDPALRERWKREIVAIKVPKSKAHEEALIQELITGNLLQEALRELDAAANVVRYLGYKLFDDKYVMVMEFCEGGSLRDLLGPIGQRRALPVEEAVSLAQGILYGLGAIHGVGVFHRDIKPDNILMAGDIPKVGDLGIATMLYRSSEKTYAALGTYAYMSPEIVSSTGASFTSDIWSVGVTMYEMLTGVWPFGDEYTPIATMLDRLRREDPEPPSAHRPGIPPHLDAAVLKALSRDPSDRYQTPDEMRMALIERDELGDKLAAVRRLVLSPDRAEEAQSALTALAREYPDSARVQRALGEFYNRCQRPRDAVRALRRAIELDPGSAQLQWDAALAYERAGKPRDAVRCLERAVELGLDEGLERHARALLGALKRGAS